MRYLAVAAVALLAACSSNNAPAPGASVTISSAGVSTTPSAPATPAAPTDPLAKLAAFTLSDLVAADTDAKAQTPPDTTASQCYDFLIALIPTIQPPSGVTQVGAILAFQRLRDLKAGVTSSNGTLKSLNLACAPLVVDTQTTINLLVGAAGGTAAAATVGLPLLAPLP